jgi:hypothetical protein
MRLSSSALTASDGGGDREASLEGKKLVLEAEFPALQFGEPRLVRQRPVRLLVDFVLKRGVLSAERFDMIRQRHRRSSFSGRLRAAGSEARQPEQVPAFGDQPSRARR